VYNTASTNRVSSTSWVPQPGGSLERARLAFEDQPDGHQAFFVSPLSLDKRLRASGIFTVFPCAASAVRMLFCILTFRQNPMVSEQAILAFLLRCLDLT
jgi:hypothetical protein